MSPIRTLLASVTLAALVLGSAHGAARVGEPAPDFTMIDSNGLTHRLSDFAGRTVVLEWFNHECPFVVKHYGARNMQAQQRDHVGEDLVWLVVNSSAPGKQGHVDGAQANAVMAEWKSANTAFLLDHDGVVGRAFDARVTPHMFIIDGEGIVRYNGAIDSIPSANPEDIPQATQYVVQALAEMRAGLPVSVPVTQPYGCSVKY